MFVGRGQAGMLYTVMCQITMNKALANYFFFLSLANEYKSLGSLLQFKTVKGPTSLFCPDLSQHS